MADKMKIGELYGQDVLLDDHYYNQLERKKTKLNKSKMTINKDKIKKPKKDAINFLNRWDNGKLLFSIWIYD